MNKLIHTKSAVHSNFLHFTAMFSDYIAYQKRWKAKSQSSSIQNTFQTSVVGDFQRAQYLEYDFTRNDKPQLVSVLK